MAMLWVQKWEESESGWGTRPDGYTLHKSKEDIDAFLRAMRDREAQEGYGPGHAPPEYSRPCGAPYETNIEDLDLVTQVMASPCGMWGPGGNNYPKPLVAGSDQSGWVTIGDGMTGRLT